jgi:hypothetical protein
MPNNISYVHLIFMAQRGDSEVGKVDLLILQRADMVLHRKVLLLLFLLLLHLF